MAEGLTESERARLAALDAQSPPPLDSVEAVRARLPVPWEVAEWAAEEMGEYWPDDLDACRAEWAALWLGDWLDDSAEGWALGHAERLALWLERLGAGGGRAGGGWRRERGAGAVGQVVLG